MPCGAAIHSILMFSSSGEPLAWFPGTRAATCLLWFGVDWFLEENLLVGSSLAVEGHKWLKWLL